MHFLFYSSFSLGYPCFKPTPSSFSLTITLITSQFGIQFSKPLIPHYLKRVLNTCPCHFHHMFFIYCIISLTISLLWFPTNSTKPIMPQLLLTMNPFFLGIMIFAIPINRTNFNEGREKLYKINPKTCVV